MVTKIPIANCGKNACLDAEYYARLANQFVAGARGYGNPPIFSINRK